MQILLTVPFLLKRVLFFLLIAHFLGVLNSHNLVAQSTPQFNFASSDLKGISIHRPTSLQFGPDGLLYVAQQYGLIKVFNVVRQSSNNYSIISSSEINLVNLIPNHNDDGSLAPTITVRQLTGILVTGTAANPIIYLSSSDSRYGGPSGDQNIDTNSGILSKLTKNGNTWDKVDLVRGLPRSEENHSTNGLQIDPTTNMLYITVGGNTNGGAPSNNFARVCEYALSASIVSIDLDVVEAMPVQGTGPNKYVYDIPTVDDPTRPNNLDGTDVGDPFGGNNGLNQAKIVPGGPVQVFATGLRTAYDFLITKTPGKEGRMYTIDNGGNQGWGGYPHNEGAHGNVTNNYIPGEPGSNNNTPTDAIINNSDALHFIGYLDSYVPGTFYGGHPNPIRANPAGAGLYCHLGTDFLSSVWRTSKTDPQYPLPADWPPVPVEMANPIEGDFQNQGMSDNSLLTFRTSTNGLAEYTASNFDNALKGNLLATGYNNNLFYIRLNEAGNDVLNLKGTSRVNQDPSFASAFGKQPLDVIAQGDHDVFPGTVWVANYVNSTITVFEPQDYLVCTGADNNLDEDGDGFTNADEIDNNTNPCSTTDKPADLDGDFISDLNDTDDDNDNILDINDYFQQDVHNGLTTNIPLKYDLFNNDPGTGFFGVGFTGLMNNGTDYLTMFNEDSLIAGGAVGAFTVTKVRGGDALGALNTQANGFQFGINVNTNTGPFTVHSRIGGPFFNNATPEDFQSLGFFIGKGDQDNYLKVELNANGGALGILVTYENNGVPIVAQYPLEPNSSNFNYVDLYLAINPITGAIQPKYRLEGSSIQILGSPIIVGGELLNCLQGPPALAVGITATSRNSIPFGATWDFFDITLDPITATGDWELLSATSGEPLGRDENAYVQAGDKFYLIGGRGIQPVQIYDPITKVWTNGTPPPIELHHFQALEYGGLIYVVGAFTGSFPNEIPVNNIYIYNPLTDIWTLGPSIPSNRARGSGGAVEFNNKIYLVGGNTQGHNSGWVSWFDEYNPTTNTWTMLPNAPRVRDHFHAAIVNGKLYAVGGRRSSTSTGQTFDLTIPEVDVYDFTTGQWSTLPNNLPTPRGNNMLAVLGNELVVFGGESGTQVEAHNETEALNVVTNTWRTLAPMVEGRHGTQAITSNNGIYVAGGVGNRGGNPRLTTQETFFMYNPTEPTGIGLTLSNLVSFPGNIALGEVSVGTSKTETITITNTQGNQDIVISSISILDPEFQINSASAFPIVIKSGNSISFDLVYTPTSTESKSTGITITYSGNTGIFNIPVSCGATEAAPLFSVNSGGQSDLNISGRIWTADQHFSTSGTSVYSNSTLGNINNTVNDTLYTTGRTSETGNISYSFPLERAGLYTVRLHFAEIVYGVSQTGGAGMRMFNINFEGGAVELLNYDIFQHVGPLAADVKTFDVLVLDGQLNIELQRNIGNPIISAIEIILQENQNPVVAAQIPDQNIVAESAFNFSFDVSAFTDPNGDLLTYTATQTGGSNLPEWLSFNSSSRTFSGTPPANSPAVLSIVVSANDPFGGSASDEFIFNVNRKPLVSNTIPAQSVAIGTSYNYLVPLNIFSDPDNDGLTYSATLSNGGNLPSWLNFNSATRTFNGIPTISNIGNIIIRVTADDNKGGVSTTDFVLNVINQNGSTALRLNSGGANVTNSIGSFSADQYFSTPSYAKSRVIGINGTTDDAIYQSERWANKTLNYNIPVTNGPLTVVLHFAEINFTLPGERRFDVTIEGVKVLDNFDIVAKVGPLTATTETITTTVSDGILNINFSSLLADGGVNNPKISAIEIINTVVSNPPVVANPIPNQIAKVGTQFSYTIPVGTFVDPDEDDLTLSAAMSNGSNLPTWLTFNGTTFVLSGTPPVGSESTLTLRIFASDGSNSAFDEFDLTIVPNSSPIVNTAIPNQTATIGQAFNFTVAEGTFTDPENEALTYSSQLTNGSPIPSWLVFNNSTGNFSGTPLTGTSSPVSIRVFASDGINTAFDDFDLIINNHPVVSASIPNQNATIGLSYNYAVPVGTFTDPDNDVLVYYATLSNDSELPSWLVFNSSSRTLSGVPPVGSQGEISIKISAEDNKGGSVSTLFSITVIQPVTPTFLRFNSGGGNLVTSIGNFSADQYFTTPSYSKTYNLAIAGTTNDALYQTERWAVKTLNYNIPLNNGQYSIILHFAELGFTETGKRQFDVTIEGVKVLDNYDIVAKAGAFTATTETFNTTVADGTLNLNLSSLAIDGGINNPKISAIEIIGSSSNSFARKSSPEIDVEKEKVVVDAYPVPFNETLNLIIKANKDQEYDIKVNDVLGNEIYTSKFTPRSFEPEAHSIDFSRVNASQGNVFFVTINDRNNTTRKVIKVIQIKQ